MPFGLVFASLFFGVICPWGAVGLIARESTPGQLAGGFLAVLGVTLAWAMLTRRGWARVSGVTASLGVGALALWRISQGAHLADHAMFLGAFATLVLLAVPVTGRVAGAPTPGAGGVLGSLVGTALAGMMCCLGWAAFTEPERGSTTHELPASAAMRQIRWGSDYDAGLEQARRDGSVMLVTFVTDWCGYCRKMSKTTWRSRPVVERMDDLVPVKLNGDSPGVASVARRLRVQGYPANFLIGADGRVLARKDGYLGPTQLLAWLDRTVGRASS